MPTTCPTCGRDANRLAFVGKSPAYVTCSLGHVFAGSMTAPSVQR